MMKPMETARIYEDLDTEAVCTESAVALAKEAVKRCVNGLHESPSILVNFEQDDAEMFEIVERVFDLTYRETLDNEIHRDGNGILIEMEDKSLYAETFKLFEDGTPPVVTVKIKVGVVSEDSGRGRGSPGGQKRKKDVVAELEPYMEIDVKTTLNYLDVVGMPDALSLTTQVLPNMNSVESPKPLSSVDIFYTKKPGLTEVFPPHLTFHIVKKADLSSFEEMGCCVHMGPIGDGSGIAGAELLYESFSAEDFVGGGSGQEGGKDLVLPYTAEMKASSLGFTKAERENHAFVRARAYLLGAHLIDTHPEGRSSILSSFIAEGLNEGDTKVWYALVDLYNAHSLDFVDGVTYQEGESLYVYTSALEPNISEFERRGMVSVNFMHSPLSQNFDHTRVGISMAAADDKEGDFPYAMLLDTRHRRGVSFVKCDFVKSLSQTEFWDLFEDGNLYHEDTTDSEILFEESFVFVEEGLPGTDCVEALYDLLVVNMGDSFSLENDYAVALGEFLARRDRLDELYEQAFNFSVNETRFSLQRVAVVATPNMHSKSHSVFTLQKLNS